MKKISYVRVLATLTLALSLSLGACSKKKEGDETVGTNTAAMGEDTLGDSDSGKAGGLQTVNFAYDSFTIDAAAKTALNANAAIMKDKAALKIQVEGHCDQQGGTQYNLALGERRANAAKKYLQDQGVAADRISIISYGEEKPLDPALTEAAYAKNRRANFVITSR